MAPSMHMKALRYLEASGSKWWAVKHHEGFLCEWEEPEGPNWLDDQGWLPEEGKGHVWRVARMSPTAEGLMKILKVKKEDCMVIKSAVVAQEQL